MFGASGLGNAFEYSSHAIVMGTNGKHWCKRSTGECQQIELSRQSQKLIRNVNDIPSLKNGDYGLPTICNFPIVDAVLPPALGLQMTTSKRHGGSVLQLRDILKALKIRASEFTIVYVVPEHILPDFTFPATLGNVNMYVTTPRACSKEAFLQLFSN